MSNKIKQKKNNHLQLINSTYIPKYNNSVFNPDNNTLIYPVSSNIIIHDLMNNTKNIIDNIDTNEISNLKILDKDKKLLLSISKNKFPKINILSLNPNNNHNKIIFTKIIPIEENFSVNNIFLDRFRYNLFLIILSSIDANIIYFFHISNINKNKYDIIPYGKLYKTDMEIIDFKCFYNDNLLVSITRNSLNYYKINLENKICEYLNNIKFHSKLLSYSLKIDRKNSLIAILTGKGECLIYDKEIKNISNIECPIKREYYINNIFSDYNNSLCLTTNNGNIFIYKIEFYNDTYVFKVKNYIKYSHLNKIINAKYQFNNILINNADNNYKNIVPFNENINNEARILYYNEKDDLIIITLGKGNSFIKASLSFLINKKDNLDELNIIYEFNHNKKINNGIIIYNADSSYDKLYEDIIFTCSNDNKLIKKYYHYSSNKFTSYYFDFNYLFKEPNTYITSIRFHPKYGEKILYAGDNKGCLYIIYKERNYQYQKFYLNKENYFNEISIISIIFSPNSDYIIYIGFNNGMQRLYDLSVDKNFNYYKLLSNGFLDKSEINYRIEKNHVICFCHFFIYKYNLKNCFLFLNNQNTIKISKIWNDDLMSSNNYSNEVLLIKSNNKILDLRIHKNEDYIIILNNQRQIIIKELHLGNIVSKIDLNEIMNYIYNLEMDISGLYLSIICDFKNSPLYSNKSSIVIMELNSGKIKKYIKEFNLSIAKSKFDYYGRYLITFGEKGGEISIFNLDKEIKNNIVNAIKQIKIDFFNYWENYKIKNNNEISINNNIINEILTENQNNIKNYIEYDNYECPEDFFRINNHGEKSLDFIANTINNKNNSISNENSLFKEENISGKNNFTTNISRSISNKNFNEKKINTKINTQTGNTNLNNQNNLYDDFIMEDHYINRKSNNYKNSINYIATFRNNYNNDLINKKNYGFENQNELEKKNTFDHRNYYKQDDNIRKRSIGSNNNKIIINNHQKKEEIKSKSLRDIIMTKSKEIPKITKPKKEINKNGNDNNNYIETPHFLLSPKSINSNDYNRNMNEIKKSLNLLSLPKQTLTNSLINLENDNNILDLKKKIIAQSSNLLHNERRMVNLANALNKVNNNIDKNPEKNDYSKEEEKDKNLSNTHISKNSSRNNNINKNRYLNFDKRIMFGDNNDFNSVKGKYPEPDDIDNNLVNINTNKNNDIFKNNNVFKIDKNYEIYENNNKNDDSCENLYFINNKDNNSNINSNYYNKSASLSIIKDIQYNNNSSMTKNNSNLINENINEITNLNNTSIGEQISYLNNNINRFEKNFAN